jgi:hypothetical protein
MPVDITTALDIDAGFAQASAIRKYSKMRQVASIAPRGHRMSARWTSTARRRRPGRRSRRVERGNPGTPTSTVL